MSRPLQALWVATKPPHPPIDGGRVLMLRTLEALAREQVRVTLFAPCERSRLRPTASALEPYCEPRLLPQPGTWLRRLAALAHILGGGLPGPIALHRAPALERSIARFLARRAEQGSAIDVVHVEQLQALPQVGRSRASRPPVLLRAQNVESDLWAQAASSLGGLQGLVLRGQARRLARWEAHALQRVDRVVVLSREDGRRIATLTGDRARSSVLPPPFPAELPAAEGELPGRPPVVLIGSGGWRPNVESADWFQTEVWPAVRSRLPEAQLHLFGFPRRAEGGVSSLPRPKRSRDAFVPGSLLVVPLRIASGVRIKILEAWARGIPVVATRAAAGGLGSGSPQALLLADNAEEYAGALARLNSEPALQQQLVSSGRQRLRAENDPAKVAGELVEIYRRLARPREAADPPETA